MLDWFRNKDGDNGVLLRNAGWLQNFLYATGLIDNSSVEPSENIRRVESVYKASGMAMNQHSWAYLYDNLERISIAHDFFLESCSSELVIGYELSRAQLQAIDKAGKGTSTFVRIPFDSLQIISSQPRQTIHRFTTD